MKGTGRGDRSWMGGEPIRGKGTGHGQENQSEDAVVLFEDTFSDFSANLGPRNYYYFGMHSHDLKRLTPIQIPSHSLYVV